MSTEKTFSMKLVLISLFMLISATMMAQVTVTGRVIDMQGGPIAGASVCESGTKSATVTDKDGKYAINVLDANAILNVSFIGYQPQTVRLSGRRLVTISLEDDETALKDIVVVGYGTMKKSDVTGAVSVVDTKDIMKKVPTNIAQALQGLAGGVYVSQQDGAPDANTQVRIRGVGTVFGSSLPLYVVDGVKVGTDANFINPADIETLEVLKDASATAIYGSEGANGVIMITTKHGQAGRTEFSFKVDCGIGTLPYKLDVIGVDELAYAIRKSRENDGANLVNKIWEEQHDGKRSTIDWQDQMIQLALKQQYGLTILGGNEKTQYNFSINYLNNKGLVVNTNYNRFSGRVGVKSNLTEFIEAGGDINFTRSETSGSNVGLGNNVNLSSHRDIAYMTPTLDYIDSNTGNYVHVNVVNPDGTYGYMGEVTTNGWEGNTNILGNIYATQMELGRNDFVNRFAVSAYTDVRFFKGLNYRVIGSYTYTGANTDDFSGGRRRFNQIGGEWTEVAYTGENRYNFSLGLNYENDISVEHYLTYKLKTDLHSLSAMIGNSVNLYRGSWTNTSGRDFYSGDIRMTTLAKDQSSKVGSGAFNPDANKLSYYARFVYGFSDLFNMTATIRRDGSSNFSPNHRWGTFPSFGAAWRIKESFLQNVDAVSNLKLRAGWGQTGNAGNIGGKWLNALTSSQVLYNFYTSSGLGKGSASSGLYAPLVDPDLKWETNEQVNVGLDLGLIDGDLTLSLDYFVRKTKDLLIYFPIRPSAGYSQIYTNYGAIQNKGIEFTATYRKYLGKDWTLNATLTGSTINNKITDMPSLPIYRDAEGGNYMYASKNQVDDIVGDNSNTLQVDAGAHWDNHSISQVGYAVGSYYGWRVDRIIKTEEDLAEAHRRGQTKAKIGDYMFKDLDGKTDVNGNLVCDDGDREVLGNGFPALNFGFNVALTYKNWDFALYSYGELGKKILSYSAMRLSMITTSDDNTTAAILKSSFSQVYDPVTNPNGTLPAYSFNSDNYNQRVSDAWVKNGNFFKISNLQVGYSFNERTLKALHMQKARVYFAVQNLATISPYTKYGDPECGQGSVLFTGFDSGRYPMARTYMLGFNVTF